MPFSLANDLLQMIKTLVNYDHDFQVRKDKVK